MGSQNVKQVIASALAGILLASIYWLYYSSKRAQGPTDEMLKRMHSTRAQYDKFDSVNSIIGSVDKQNHLHLSDSQFQRLQDVLTARNAADVDYRAKMTAIVVLSKLTDLVQQKRAMRLIHPYLADANYGAVIYALLLRYWSNEGRALVLDAANDPEPLFNRVPKQVVAQEVSRGEKK